MRAALHDGDPERLLPMVAEGGLPGDERIEVYRTMYWARLAEALAADFPLVRRMLGEGLFDRVAVTHVKRHPSRSPSLAFLGRHLDETLVHLGQHTEAAVARLEWARVEAFWSVDAEVATPLLLGSLGGRLGEAVLSFHPSLRLVRLPACVGRIAAGEAPEATREADDESWVVWRKGNAVSERVVAPLEALAVSEALGGSPMSTVCEAFLEADAPEEAAIAAVLRWVRDGWVSGAHLDVLGGP